MAILGLEGDNYCVHAPIPISRPGSTSGFTRLQIVIDGNDMLTRPPIICQNDAEAFLDLSPWVRQFLPVGDVNFSYNTTSTSMPIPNRRDMGIRVYTLDGEDFETRTFVSCSLDNQYTANVNALRVWSCYPLSYINGADFTTVVLSASGTITSDREVEYIRDCCNGIYLRWLNRYGDYNYWLFPNAHTLNTEGDEIYNIPQNIFNPNRDGSHVSAGFDVKNTLTVRDLIPKKYWQMFQDLVGSPVVHMLKSDYVLGSNVSPTDWVRVIQDNPDFERGGFARTTAEFEMDLVLPDVYSQKLI